MKASSILTGPAARPGQLLQGVQQDRGQHRRVGEPFGDPHEGTAHRASRKRRASSGARTGSPRCSGVASAGSVEK